jgi:hypothetical protein
MLLAGPAPSPAPAPAPAPATKSAQSLLANPDVRYLLALNGRNLVDQANRTPHQAAKLRPHIEASG